jgi:hypothetical protein
VSDAPAVEDYEHLEMVKDAAARTANPGAKTEPFARVREALAEVPKPYRGWFEWGRDTVHARPDRHRLRVLLLLESPRPEAVDTLPRMFRPAPSRLKSTLSAPFS